MWARLVYAMWSLLCLGSAVAAWLMHEAHLSVWFVLVALVAGLVGAEGIRRTADGAFPDRDSMGGA
jgi:hypothetical protein